jgi:hypothetical protein
MLWGHNVSYKILDRGLIEYIGPTGISNIIKKFGIWLSSLQSGYVYNYAFTIFLGTTVFILIINNNELYKNIEILAILPIFAYNLWNTSDNIKNVI